MERNLGTGVIQSAILIALQGTIIAVGLVLWARGEASTGDVSRLVATQFLLSGYLRDVGQHVRNIPACDQRNGGFGCDSENGPRRPRCACGKRSRRAAWPYRLRGCHLRLCRGAAPLYDRFSLEIKAGERVGLVGPSGAGKSTFVKLLQRLYDVDGGRILIDGQDIAGVTQASLRSAIGIVAQEPILFHRTLAENIAYGRPEADRTSMQEAARFAHAEMFIERLPHAYETLVGERGVKLSGGERQRVAIARAILSLRPSSCSTRRRRASTRCRSA